MKMVSRHIRSRLTRIGAAVLLTSGAATAPAVAGFITDPVNDFIPSFTGTHDPSLDVLSFSATFDGTTFKLIGVENGTISTFATGLFVIGFNRGAGTPGFASIGHGGVLFDSVVTLTSAGVLGGNITGAGITKSISGSTFEIDVPLTSVPSLGFTPSQYAVNLWPRDTSQAGTAAISDFAPDNSDLVVPEPISLSLLGTGLFGLSLVRRRRS